MSIFFEIMPSVKTYTPLERELKTIRLHIDLNTICNQKCNYCYARQNKNDWGLIQSSDSILRHLDELYSIKEDSYIDVVLLGGEPTLHPDFNRIVEYLLGHSDTRVSVTSNGFLNYKNVRSDKNIRFAFTYHPSQVHNIDEWYNPIKARKNDFWEVAISPLIDCWNDIEKNALLVKNMIERCHNDGIKVQPTFQFNPVDRVSHISMNEVMKYYSYLEKEEPSYLYDKEPYNDYNILKDGKNYLQGCRCYSNNFQLSVRGRLVQCCSNIELDWKELVHYPKFLICPLKECTCYGFLSFYKEL